MSFFPALFFGVALSGRDLLINDASPIGKLCTVVKCAFPLRSTIDPDYESNPTLSLSLEDIKQLVLLNSTRYSNRKTLEGKGYQSHLGGWILKHPEAKSCISKLSGCIEDDINCAERYAYHSLIVGPFYPKYAAMLEQRVQGVSRDMLHAILYQNFTQLPRFDAGIQVRLQKSLFENNKWPNETNQTSFFEEPHGIKIVAEFTSALHSYFTSTSQSWNNHIFNNTLPRDHPLVYISVDDTVEKDIFVRHLNLAASSNHLHAESSTPINISYVHNNEHITHAKFWNANLLSSSVVESIFDWVALSLCNVLFAYRYRLYTTEWTSSFVLSASRVNFVDLYTNDSVKIHFFTGKRFSKVWAWPSKQWSNETFNF